YHPDKVGINFDPHKYEIFQAAYQVLSDSSLKSQYDQYRHAKIQRQRANDLFEGKRRRMKEDLEAREKNGVSGLNKRSRDEEAKQAELQSELRRLAEEGRKRRAARERKMAENAMSSPTSVPLKESSHGKNHEIPVTCTEDEEKIERLEQRIREAEEAKAKRKLKRKAQKGGLKTSIDDESSHTGSSLGEQRKHIPLKLSKASSSPKISSPSFSMPKNDDFAATMARLRAAEKARQEKDLKKEESETAQVL
ncbi:hypothetical protein EPUL_001012, partial [Erysiphe pulchra]